MVDANSLDTGPQAIYFSGSAESISEQQIERQTSLNHCYPAAKSRQYHTIGAEPGGKIAYQRSKTALDANRPGQRLVDAHAGVEAMGKGWGGEVDHQRTAKSVVFINAQMQNSAFVVEAEGGCCISIVKQCDLKLLSKLPRQCFVLR